MITNYFQLNIILQQVNSAHTEDISSFKKNLSTTS